MPAAGPGSPASGSLPCQRRGPSPADRRLGIVAERRGQRALIAGLGLEAGDRRAAAMVERPRKRVMLGPRRRQGRARRRKLALRRVARFGRRRAALARPRPGALRPRPAPRAAGLGLRFRRRRCARSCSRAVAERLRAARRAAARSCSVRPSWARAASSAASATRRSARIAACRASSSASAASASRDAASRGAELGRDPRRHALRHPRAAARSPRVPPRTGRWRRRHRSSAPPRARCRRPATRRAGRARPAGERPCRAAPARSPADGASSWPCSRSSVERGAPLGQRFVGLLLRGLRLGDRLLDALDLARPPRALPPSRPRRARFGLAPARVEQPRLDAADLVGQLAIAFRRPRLAPKLRRALLLVAENFAEPGEIGFGRAKLLLGVLAPRVESRNARRFLEQQPAFDRLGGNDRADLALADQRRRMRAGRGVGEQQRDVLGADVAAVDPIGRAGAALDPPRDLAFAARRRRRPRRARAGSKPRRNRAAAGSRCRRR